MEEYLYEMQNTNPEDFPRRVKYLVDEYKKNLSLLINSVEKYSQDAASNSLSDKKIQELEDVFEIKRKYDIVSESLSKIDKKNLLKKRELKILSQRKITQYSRHLHELISCLLEEKEEDTKYVVSDSNKVEDFLKDGKIPKGMIKLEKKYNLKKVNKKDLVWAIAEKMYNFRPF